MTPNRKQRILEKLAAAMSHGIKPGAKPSKGHRNYQAAAQHRANVAGKSVGLRDPYLQQTVEYRPKLSRTLPAPTMSLAKEQ